MSEAINCDAGTGAAFLAVRGFTSRRGYGYWFRDEMDGTETRATIRMTFQHDEVEIEHLVIAA